MQEYSLTTETFTLCQCVSPILSQMLITLLFARSCWPEDMSVGGGGGGGGGGSSHTSHLASWCSLSGCQALHLFAVVCTGRTVIDTEPYYELPLSVTKLRSIFHFRVGAHSLPVEQGRIEMPQVPRHLRRCTFCATNAIGDERHCVFDCPRFQGLRQQHVEIFQDSHDAMRSLMWHKDQKSVCALVIGHCQ